MIAIYLITKNNETTIKETLESLQNMNALITIADMGSNDSTKEICNSYGITPKRLSIKDRSKAINEMTKITGASWNMYIEPWERIVKGSELIKEITKGEPSCYAVNILQNKTIVKETRIWPKGFFFKNPIKEKLNCPESIQTEIIFLSKGKTDYKKEMEQIKKWKKENPSDNEPYYHEAMNYLAQGDYKNFISLGSQYIFKENKNIIKSVMTRYYLSMVYLSMQNINSAIKNISICIAENPIMAEFWCLVGDIHIQIRDFAKAIHFYKNALILGNQRYQTDKWPMNIAKYKDYPEEMIKKCEKIISKIQNLTH